MADSVQDPKDTDWRVRLHLADHADYLYKSNDPGILYPLRATDGIIFPYTPTFQIQYQANYKNYDLTHSNFRGYYYSGSVVASVMMTATFTANDVIEANYLLATLHFLRSATKMFYGQDIKRGTPPPVVYLTGYGEYQFNNHPCLINMFSYNLPDDVDYIPAEQPPVTTERTSGKVTGDMKSIRRAGANIGKGGLPLTKTGMTYNTQGAKSPDPVSGVNIYEGRTYIPTKIDLNFTMLPLNTRDQVSNEFSLKDYANGKLLKKGFW